MQCTQLWWISAPLTSLLNLTHNIVTPHNYLPALQSSVFYSRYSQFTRVTHNSSENRRKLIFWNLGMNCKIPKPLGNYFYSLPNYFGHERVIVSGLMTWIQNCKLVRSLWIPLDRMSLPLYISHLQTETWYIHSRSWNAIFWVLWLNGVTANMTEVDASKSENHNCMEMISYHKIHNSNGLFWYNMQWILPAKQYMAHSMASYRVPLHLPIVNSS